MRRGLSFRKGIKTVCIAGSKQVKADDITGYLTMGYGCGNTSEMVWYLDGLYC